MEEQLRFNLDNFWEESSYREGNLTNLSLHHPLNILSALMCRFSITFFSVLKNGSMPKHMVRS